MTVTEGNTGGTLEVVKLQELHVSVHADYEYCYRHVSFIRLSRECDFKMVLHLDWLL